MFKVKNEKNGRFVFNCMNRQDLVFNTIEKAQKTADDKNRDTALERTAFNNKRGHYVVCAM
jgi:hypothetical protein